MAITNLFLFFLFFSTISDYEELKGLNINQMKPENLPTKREGIELRDLSGTNRNSASVKSSRLQFQDIPAGSAMKIKELHLEDEISLFWSFSLIMDYMYPQSYPVGTYIF